MTNLPIMTHSALTDDSAGKINKDKDAYLGNWKWVIPMMFLPFHYSWLCFCWWQLTAVTRARAWPSPRSLCPPGWGLPPLLSSHSAGRDNLWSRPPPGRPRHLPPVSRGRETGNVPGSRGAEGGQGSGQTRSSPWSSHQPRQRNNHASPKQPGRESLISGKISSEAVNNKKISQQWNGGTIKF